MAAITTQPEPGVGAVAAPSADGAAPAARGRLAVVCLSHGVVDFFSAIVVPLLSVLEGRLEMTHAQGALLVAVGSLASGLVQPVVAWLADRHDTRLLGTLGFAVAAVAVGGIGWAGTYTQLVLLQIVGTAGIGAFHPVAAASVGQLARRRSAAVAVFFSAGLAGGTAGSWVSPFYAEAFGLRGFAWLIAPALVVVAALAWATHSVPHRTSDAHSRHGALSAEERRARWTAIGVLYATNALRFIVNMALVYLVVRWAEGIAIARAGTGTLDAATRADASQLNGPIQAAMAIGMAVGGLTAGLVRTQHEKAAIVAVPVLGALAVAAFPYAPGPAAAAVLMALCGAGFAGIIPITIALAQRLLPHRTGLASGLMMGGAWALAAAGPLIAEPLIKGLGLHGAFVVVAGTLVLAGLLGLALPGWLIHRTAGH